MSSVKKIHPQSETERSYEINIRAYLSVGTDCFVLNFFDVSLLVELVENMPFKVR